MGEFVLTHERWPAGQGGGEQGLPLLSPWAECRDPPKGTWQLGEQE